jgi:hypothetical protein
VRLANARAIHHAIELAESIDRDLRRGVAHLGPGDVAGHADGLGTASDETHGLLGGLVLSRLGFNMWRATHAREARRLWALS